MSLYRQAHSLGEAIETEYELTLAEFAASIRRPGEREELLALGIRRVEGSYVRKRGGLYEITTTVYAQRSRDDLTRFGRYTISWGYSAAGVHNI